MYRAITVSGKIGVGTSTLARKLSTTLGWEYLNGGQIQREYDRKHHLDTNRGSALDRSDEHEREIDQMVKDILKTREDIVYEAWLAGFMTQGIRGLFRVLLICSDEAVRIDRVVNRDGMTVDDAKHYIRQREEGNLQKWHVLYGMHDFWDPKYYDLVIDTYSSGPMESMGKVLDAIGHGS